jgi:hypothetical protein
MPSAVIHIGAHKTGTSALQNWLGQHRDLLSANNTLYPLTGKWIHDHSHNLFAASILQAVDTGFTGKFLEQLQLLEQEIRDNSEKNLIISSEMLEHAPIYGREYLLQLLQLLAKYYKTIRVAYCLRPPSELITSVFKQWVQDYDTRYSGCPVDLANSLRDRLDFSTIAAKWHGTEFIESVDAYWYDGIDRLANFKRSLRCFGLSDVFSSIGELNTASRENNSLDGQLLAIKHALNPYLTNKTTHDNLLADLRLLSELHPKLNYQLSIFDLNKFKEFNKLFDNFSHPNSINIYDYEEIYDLRKYSRSKKIIFTSLTKDDATSIVRSLLLTLPVIKTDLKWLSTI